MVALCIREYCALKGKVLKWLWWRDAECPFIRPSVRQQKMEPHSAEYVGAPVIIQLSSVATQFSRRSHLSVPLPAAFNSSSKSSVSSLFVFNAVFVAKSWSLSQLDNDFYPVICLFCDLAKKKKNLQVSNPRLNSFSLRFFGYVTTLMTNATKPAAKTKNRNRSDSSCVLASVFHLYEARKLLWRYRKLHLTTETRLVHTTYTTQ